MKRVIESLNEMSFDLPEGWNLTEDVYSLPNGQGMVNIENYLSDKGEVISLFGVHRDPSDFFVYYESLLNKYKGLTQKYELALKTKIRVGEFILPTYIIKSFAEQKMTLVQVFVNCGDCLACFMINIDEFDGTIRGAMRQGIFKELIKLLRTVE